MSRLRLSGRARASIIGVSLLVVALALGSWLWFLWRALHDPVGRYDFSSYYAAAAALRADPHADIYSATVMAQSGAANHVQVQPPLPYTYPPLLAIALVPLTLVPFNIASRLWLLANAGFWLGCALLLARELRVRFAGVLSPGEMAPPAGTGHAWSRLSANPAPIVALAISAALFLPAAPAQQTVLLGQIDLLVLVFLAAVPWLIRHGHERWLGAAIALAAMLKLTPALLLVYLALRRRWEALIAGLLALAVLTIVSVAVVGPTVALAALPEALRVGSGDATLGQNEALLAPVLGMVAGAAPGLADTARAVEYVLLAALALAVGWVLWRPGMAVARSETDGLAVGRGSATDEASTYAVALCAMVLLSPAAWVHHYVWVLPAAALTLGITLAAQLRALFARDTARHRGAPLTGLALALVGSFLLVWMLPYNWDTEPNPAISTVFGLPLRPLFLELRPVGALLILIVAATLAPRRRHPAATEGREAS